MADPSSILCKANGTTLHHVLLLSFFHSIRPQKDFIAGKAGSSSYMQHPLKLIKICTWTLTPTTSRRLHECRPIQGY